MGKGRTFSDPSKDAVYQKGYDNEVYSAAAQQNSYNLGSTHFSDQSGIGNFTQAGSDQRKANLKGALFTGNVGFNLQTAVLDVGTNTINLNNDSSSAALSIVSTDRFVTLSAGSTADLVTITGAQRPGQRLRLYNTLTNTITIKHTAAATVNTIRTPDAGDFIFPGNGVVDLTYDITTTQWRVVSGSSGGGFSGLLSDLTIDVTKDWLNFGINNLSSIQISDSVGGVHGLLQGIAATGTRLTITSGEKFQIHDNITSMIELNTASGLVLNNLDFTTGTGNIVTGGAGEGMTNTGHIDFVDNLATPGATFSIYSDGTDLFANTGSGVKNLDEMVTESDTNVFTAINTFNENIVGGGAGDGMTNVGHFDFIDNLATPVAAISLYSDGTDLFANTGGGVKNISNMLVSPLTADLDFGDNNAFNINTLTIVRDDGTARMSVIGGLTTSTQVLQDLVTGVDWRLSEALSDIIFWDSSGATINFPRNVSFTGGVTAISSSTISLGDSPSDIINFFGTGNSDLNMGNDNSIVDVNDIGIVRDDGTARMNIIGGLTTSTQVLFDTVTNIDIRFTEGLADRFEIQNSTNSIRCHVPLDLESNGITSVASIQAVSGVIDAITTNSSTTVAGYRDLGHSADPTGPLEGELYYNTTSNVYRFYNGTSWADMGAGGGPPFDDNQVIIQDESDNTKTLTFNLSLQSTGASNLLSWASGASRTHTFSATTGTVAQLNLAQTFTAQQTVNANFAVSVGSNLYIDGQSGGEYFKSVTNDLEIHWSAGNFVKFINGSDEVIRIEDDGTINFIDVGHDIAPSGTNLTINLGQKTDDFIISNVNGVIFQAQGTVNNKQWLQVVDGGWLTNTGANGFGIDVGSVVGTAHAPGSVGSINLPHISASAPSNATLDSSFNPAARKGSIGIIDDAGTPSIVVFSSNGTWYVFDHDRTI